MIVYVAQNLFNGKRYVGKTVSSLNHRWSMHKGDSARGSKLAFHAAIRKYGQESFYVSVICECTSDEAAFEIEREMILRYSSHVTTGFGYNVTWGGEGLGSGDKHPSFGKTLSESTRRKISEAQQGSNNSSHKHSGDGHWNRGLVRSEETRKKIREARSKQVRGPRKPMSEETKNKIRATRALQAPITKEARDKISFMLRGRPVSEETRNKIGAAHKGMKHTEEAKIKISLGNRGRISPMKGKTHSAESVKKNSLSHLGKQASLETKLKMAESQKRAWSERRAKCL